MDKLDRTTAASGLLDDSSNTLRLQTIQDSRVLMGAGANRGFETPTTEWCININVVPIKEGVPDPSQPLALQLWITSPLLASIVKQFFKELFLAKPFYMQQLRRMLRKRWGMMTSPAWKTDHGDGEWVRLYDNPLDF